MNHSANRGACMQVCRRSYTVRDKETDVELDIDNQYIMSPKDLKTIHFMNKMLDAGVRVFKIEGRARGPEYVRTVVECYKEAIKAYQPGDVIIIAGKGHEDYQILKNETIHFDDREEARKVFN